jgi:hypothetical protein
MQKQKSEIVSWTVATLEGWRLSFKQPVIALAVLVAAGRSVGVGDTQDLVHLTGIPFTGILYRPYCPNCSSVYATVTTMWRTHAHTHTHR